MLPELETRIDRGGRLTAGEALEPAPLRPGGWAHNATVDFSTTDRVVTYIIDRNVNYTGVW
ncbi:MAG: hypothetical protein R2712_06605 [Vicinamibacterales bacterium]